MMDNNSGHITMDQQPESSGWPTELEGLAAQISEAPLLKRKGIAQDKENSGWPTDLEGPVAQTSEAPLLKRKGIVQGKENSGWPTDLEGPVAQTSEAPLLKRKGIAQDKENSVPEGNNDHPVTDDGGSKLNEKSVLTDHNATVNNPEVVVLDEALPPNKRKNVSDLDLQAVGSTSQQQNQQSKLNLQKGLLSSLKQGNQAHCGQQKNTEKIQEILSIIQSTVKKQQADKSEHKVLLDNYQKRDDTQENIEHTDDPIMISPELQNDQQEICHQISSHDEELSNQENHSGLVQQQNDYNYQQPQQQNNDNYQQPQQSDYNYQHPAAPDNLQGSLQGVQSEENLSYANMPPLSVNTRQAEIQNVQQIVLTQEGHQTVQHPHIFAPEVHRPIIFPCQISTPPVVPTNYEVTCPLSVETNLQEKIYVPVKSTYSNGQQMYLECPTEKGESASACPGAENTFKDMLLATVDEAPMNLTLNKNSTKQ